MSGGVGGCYNAEQVDVKASYKKCKIFHGLFVGYEAEPDLFDEREFLIINFQPDGRRQNSVFKCEHAGFFAIDFFNSFDRARMGIRTLAKRKDDERHTEDSAPQAGGSLHGEWLTSRFHGAKLKKKLSHSKVLADCRRLWFAKSGCTICT